MVISNEELKSAQAQIKKVKPNPKKANQLDGKTDCCNKHEIDPKNYRRVQTKATTMENL